MTPLVKVYLFPKGVYTIYCTVPIRRPGYAGVIDQNIQAPQAIYRFLHQNPAVFKLANIAANGQTADPVLFLEFPSQRLTALYSAGGYHH